MSSDIQTADAGSQSIARFLQGDGFRKEIAKVLPSVTTPERMVRIALTEIRANPKLASCTAASLGSALLKAATFGLEVGSHIGHAYLVPYGAEATFMLGYRGMIELAYRSGQVSHLYADVVREGDQFVAVAGSEHQIKHVTIAPYSAPVVRVYAMARMKDGTTHFCVLYKEEVDEISRKSRSQHIWKDNWSEMAKKTAFRRLFKTLPSCATLNDALAAEETGAEAIDIEPVTPVSSTDQLADRLGAPVAE